jgi:hypothetical protein
VSSSPQYPPPASLGQSAPPARPKVIDTAFLLALAGIVFGAVGTAVTELFDRDRIVGLVRETLDRTGEPFGDADVVRLIGMFRIAGAVGILVFSGLLLLVALKVRAGRNWARLLLTLFAMLAMVNFLAAVTAEGAALSLIWSLAGVAFTVTAVIYLFRPDAVKYFTEIKKHRQR